MDTCFLNEYLRLQHHVVGQRTDLYAFYADVGAGHFGRLFVRRAVDHARGANGQVACVDEVNIARCDVGTPVRQEDGNGRYRYVVDGVESEGVVLKSEIMRLKRAFVGSYIEAGMNTMQFQRSLFEEQVPQRNTLERKSLGSTGSVFRDCGERALRMLLIHPNLHGGTNNM